MPWLLESHGTRAFIKMFPLIVHALDSGGLAAIDEMDAAIHPVVLPQLVRWFYDTVSRNKFHAQLWLSCHSASLLDDLRKEEIVICEKDRHGRSRVYSVMNVKARRDENHYRKYLSGAYGGVPLLG
jgi:AAA15 family ATPase/GTPase